MSGLVSSVEDLVSVLFIPTRYFKASSIQSVSTGIGGEIDTLLGTTALAKIGLDGANNQGLLIPDCAVEEAHTDALTLTRNPVQRGARITDHAYKEQPEVVLRWAWSNSATVNLLGSETYARQMYEAVLALQVAATPFTLSTGKRLYNNMMITLVRLLTDSGTEYAAPLEITCTEVLLVDTQSASVPSQDVAAKPQETAPVQTKGAQQAAPSTTPPSLLYRGFAVAKGLIGA